MIAPHDRQGNEESRSNQLEQYKRPEFCIMEKEYLGNGLGCWADCLGLHGSCRGIMQLRVRSSEQSSQSYSRIGEMPQVSSGEVG